MIRLAVVDDDRTHLAGMDMWPAAVPDIELRVTAPTVPALLGADRNVDVVLLDLHLRDLSAPADNVALLRAAGCRVLAVSTIPDTQSVLTAVAAGAAGYLTRDHDLSALATAVRVVAADGSVMTPELAFIISRDNRSGRPRLSDQERGVLVAYAAGSTLPSAARSAGVTPAAAREHLAAVQHRYTG